MKGNSSAVYEIGEGRLCPTIEAAQSLPLMETRSGLLGERIVAALRFA
jgi:hypothetical protein